ncbi:MAG: M23 family metallopeptidase [Spirochaetaceae bacterium]|jgi:murein DD-endopeptidase MepM/ murein hydrolase activator NlpD|nr:M23 family metallopeptidase [Spirochaetaceae bacterium]
MMTNGQNGWDVSGAWVCRVLFLGTLWVYSTAVLSTGLVHWQMKNAAEAATGAEIAADAAAKAVLDAGNAEYGTGGVSYPAGDALFENVSLETPLPAMLESEEYSSVRPVLYTSYKIKKGDMIGIIAREFGLNEDTLISVNGIKNTRIVPEGLVLKIPNQDGIAYTAQASDTLIGIAQKNGVKISDILTVNEYFSTNLQKGDTIFLPGVKLDQTALQEINGDFFIWPTTNRYVTSAYGWRRSPITHTRLFHIGIDIRGGIGAPVYAAMAGRVSYTGYNDVYGHHIVITHHSGYRTLYGHLSLIRVKSGTYVSTGQRIGDVGNSGLSTGSHLHFTVYKNGVTVNPRLLTR